MAYANKHMLMDLDYKECCILPTFPTFESYKAREATFVDYWPTLLQISTDKLILAGLFYTRKADKVVCYYCGGGFQNLTPKDNLLQLHAIMYGGCPLLYRCHSKNDILNLIIAPPTREQISKSFTVKDGDLLILQMQNFIDKQSDLQQRIGIMKRMHKKEIDIALAKANANIVKLTSDNKQLEQQVDTFKSRMECAICMENEKDSVIPCGHTFCSSCIPKFNNICPNCRRTFYFAKELFI